MEKSGDEALAWDSPPERPDGVTRAERHLKRLCEESFLTPWSHAGIYRDQGKVGRGHGKEVCDLLVVFENHVIIFSDKDCDYPNTGDSGLDWSRWFRKAVIAGADQAYGAERWIAEHPDRLFLDRACTRRFPIELPPRSELRFHRVVVAHSASRRCREELGGSGSLMIVPSLVGSMHYDPKAEFPPLYPFRAQPFAIGHVYAGKGYVHVFDDTTLDIVLKARDTISDFVEYLSRKEAFIRSGGLLAAAGEEELLGFYLKNVDANGDHDFIMPPGAGVLSLQEGTWERFARSPERRTQLQADRISYLWDSLIETFFHHYADGTYYASSHPTYAHQERILRFFARETRFRRRMLAQALRETIEIGADNDRMTRVVKPQHDSDPYYVFFTIKQPGHITDDRYRVGRSEMLRAICMVVKLKFADVQHIVGFATEPGLSNARRSEDAIYLDASKWTAEDAAEARDHQERWGFLKEAQGVQRSFKEFPLPVAPEKVFRLRRPKLGESSVRNSSCPCGSGRKYKRCCGGPNPKR